ncbi:NADH dehydrogenase [ubiquinone] 1 beta subcomplex subunit 8, mitochondrial [Schistocerca piceifrons]|uniref:NADH dehydrogenase [ubiquinone] 1 beta subcomplex subunit 8, mitochondrial n=1 Tax=Schistocerca piceifrons TaxID=274613 RepID=UPI001F5EA4E1|nr:NADH dehydrogenase [ubiquinone] 1 beta subcomplex subunit 8, mitochondrial [Schistocerca piceifrons]
MAMVVQLLRSGALNKCNILPTYQVVRKYWNKDWKPGPYPQTQKEREEAAKKYGLRPDQYEPYPDDGMGYGDYPKLPEVSGESRDPYYPWDFPEHKRNYNEPLHVEFDMFGEDRYDISGRPRFTATQQALAFIGVVGGFFGLYYLLDDYKMFRPVLAKQLPAPGVVHYTFEPAE